MYHIRYINNELKNLFNVNTDNNHKSNVVKIKEDIDDIYIHILYSFLV